MKSTDEKFRGALSFNPDIWGKDSHLRANCYVYALGDSNLVIPQISIASNPGTLSGKEMSHQPDVSEIVDLSLSDGLKRITGVESVGNGYLVGLYYSKSLKDYHWNRSNADGSVSAKWVGEKPQMVKDRHNEPAKMPEFTLSKLNHRFDLIELFVVPLDLKTMESAIQRQWDMQCTTFAKGRLRYGTEEFLVEDILKSLEPHRNALKKHPSPDGFIIIPSG